MTFRVPQESPLLPSGQLTPSWRLFFQSVGANSLGGSVSSVSITPANGISGTVTNATTTPAIQLALGNITPTSVASSGAVTGTNLSGTNTGDQTIALTGDVTGSGTGSFAATVVKIGGQSVTGLTFPASGTLATVGGNLGAATGTSLALTGALTSSGGPIGYATGAGGTVLQGTSKSTGVTLNNRCGQITTNNAALAGGAKVSFTVTNSTVGATDVPLVCVTSGGTANAYRAAVTAVAAGSFAITLENITGGSLSESPVISFIVLQGVTA